MMTIENTLYAVTIHDREDIIVSGDALFLSLEAIDKLTGNNFGDDYRVKCQEDLMFDGESLVFVGEQHEVNQVMDILSIYNFDIEVTEV